jgi:hypothetical protein
MYVMNNSPSPRRVALMKSLNIVHSWCVSLMMMHFTLRYGLPHTVITHASANIIAGFARQLLCRLITL